jgi:Fe-Mn family superoxide dismutase
VTDISRREAIGAALLGGWLTLGSDWAAGQTATAPATVPEIPIDGPYALAPLPYDYADLEPYISAQIMKLHHDIHHKGYVDAANAAVVELERIRRVGGESIRTVRAVTDSLSFNLSGHVLHTVFWKNMKKGGGGDPSGNSEIGKAIIRDFGSLEAFRGHFSAAAAQVQGSGWAILAYEPVGQRLAILQSEKHNNTGAWGSVPLLVLDVWEHAYYLQYQNKRSDYIKAFYNVVNWDDVNVRLEAARKLSIA